ncbi:MAG: septum site-determining protein MinC [Xanthomonadales bacterium]|jgi:septum site-determining protein MinC|nr:septum site-determining protein MinC [Xanthomonadales bacterium]
MSTSSQAVCELRSAHFSLFTVRVHELDLDAITATLADHVGAAPELLSRAPVVLELIDEGRAPGEELLRDLLERVRHAGLSPLGYVADGDSPLGVAVQRLKLPLLSPERRRLRAEEVALATAPAAPVEPAHPPAPRTAAPDPGLAALVATAQAPLIQTDMVRSGQRVYARGGDLVLLGPVSVGAEVIADGNVYSFHRLQGKVLAGARGDVEARIVSARFHPELVSIAGNYRVLEAVPVELKDRVVQVRLVGERLEMLPL